MNEERGRKVRSDKKRTIAAPLEENIYELVAQIGYICDRPLKDIGEVLCREGVKSTKLIDSIKEKFRRDYFHEENRLFLGDLHRTPYKVKPGIQKRLYMRFYDFEHERFSQMGYALDSSVQAAAALVLTTAMMRKDIMYPILARFIQRDLDPKRTDQLRHLCRFLDSQNPEEYITVPAIISYAIGQSLQNNQKIKRTFSGLFKI